MLPLGEGHATASRSGLPKIWRRSYPIAKAPESIGEHLRKKRFELGLKQWQAAQRMGVSARTLSLWETDVIYPKWAEQPKVEAFLGYNPFANPALGQPPGNKSQGVDNLHSKSPQTLGERIKKKRIAERKTRTAFAKELGVSVKALWEWETGRRTPCRSNKRLLGLG
jgi:DNA-binding transcriptional regulator YiaG